MIKLKTLLESNTQKSTNLEQAIVDAWNTGITDIETNISKEDVINLTKELKNKIGINLKAEKLSSGKIPTSKYWINYTGKEKDEPKTDIMIGTKYRISLKYGNAQLMSGIKKEARATFFAAALACGMDEDVFEAANIYFSDFISNFKTSQKSTSDLKKANEKDLTVKEIDEKIQLLKTTKIHEEFSSFLNELSKNYPGFKEEFVKEAMSGIVKFDNSNGAAEYVLSVKKDGTAYIFKNVNNVDFLKKIIDVTNIAVTFKSNSNAGGGYNISSVIRIGVTELEKLKNEVQRLNESVFTTDFVEKVIAKIKEIFVKIINFFIKIFKSIINDIKKIINFFEIDVIVDGNEIDDLYEKLK